MKPCFVIGLACASCFLAGCAPRQALAPAAPPQVVLQIQPPVPPATAAFSQTWTTMQVVQAFKSAGLEAEKSFVMSHKDYGIGPMTAGEGRRFFIPSLGPDNGGHVLAFANGADLAVMRNYYVGLGKSSAALYSYVYTRDNVLVQINGDLSEAKAAKYQAALENMK